MIQHRGKILPLLIPYIKVVLLDLFCFVSLAMALLNQLQLLRREDKRAFLAPPQLFNHSKQEEIGENPLDVPLPLHSYGFLLIMNAELRQTKVWFGVLLATFR
ncbi:unnamed protein product [Mucor hiemalis]